jgi:solute carrier family 27 fatty acid transporter 1/4
MLPINSIGENVSTTEVEGVIAKGSGMKAGVVYGVQLPGTEGRCGMATIADPDQNLDIDKLTSEINRQLPKYARPIFIRIIKEITMTGERLQ